MVSLTSLLVPILVSAVLVFLASSVLHMFLAYHWSDVQKVPNEEGVRNALRPFNIPPGDYMVPRAGSPKEMKDPAFTEKIKQGPVVLMTVLPAGPHNMGKSLGQWFGYCVVIALFAAYIASRTLAPGAPYMSVFRIVGTVAFLGFAGGLWQDSIWWSRKWSTTFKSTVDSLVYGLLTAGTFGWLWPD
ncbi:MAG: hypothetical protein H7Y88_07565 [Phycisphaerales bacterium]|nr:hypothetical protein [Phycisphaerales bacterium]